MQEVAKVRKYAQGLTMKRKAELDTQMMRLKKTKHGSCDPSVISEKKTDFYWILFVLRKAGLTNNDVRLNLLKYCYCEGGELWRITKKKDPLWQYIYCTVSGKFR